LFENKKSGTLLSQDLTNSAMCTGSISGISSHAVAEKEIPPYFSNQISQMLASSIFKYRNGFIFQGTIPKQLLG
jgi:hypothetical protein